MSAPSVIVVLGGRLAGGRQFLSLGFPPRDVIKGVFAIEFSCWCVDNLFEGLILMSACVYAGFTIGIWRASRFKD